MFKFLKEKIKSLIGKKKKEIEEVEAKTEEIEKKEGEEKEKRKVGVEGKRKEREKEKEEVEKGIKEETEKREQEREEREEREKREEMLQKQKESKETILDRIGVGKVKITEDRFYEFFEELRLTLWQNNVANEVVELIEDSLKKNIVGKEVKKKEFENFMLNEFRKVIKGVFVPSPPFLNLLQDKLKEKRPAVVVFFGINGSGKTTTIAKIAWLLKKNKLSCVLAAGDTFRAASIEQLEKHAKKLDVEIVKHKYGSDPAAVAFDAINYAKAHGIDVVLIDTSGRMHTEKNLMDEMKKICKVARPDFKVFVGEAIVGNDAVEQGKAFNEAVGIDGIVLAKADVDEKGGAALSISYVTKKPIWFLGVGQGYDDLEAFDVEKVIERIL